MNELQIHQLVFFYIYLSMITTDVIKLYSYHQITLKNIVLPFRGSLTYNFANVQTCCKHNKLSSNLDHWVTITLWITKMIMSLYVLYAYLNHSSDINKTLKIYSVYAVKCSWPKKVRLQSMLQIVEKMS